MKPDEVYEYNDYELLYMIRAKNEIALTLLLEKYKESSGNMIRKYFGKKADVNMDDYLQSARLKLLQAIEDYREDGVSSFHHFYFEILRNHLIDVYRRTFRYTTPISLDMYVQEDQHSYCMQDFIRNEEVLPISYETQQRIHAQKQLLDDIEQRILELRIWGFSYHQIADELQIKEKKVDNTMAKIRRRNQSE